jgi:dipeptidyl aminopeptidase/acylaminoacyl peptidase
MRRVLILFFTVFYVVPTFAQAKHPFTFEDMMSLKRVAEPVPSPDGKWVLFSAVDVDLASNKKTPHIWIVPLSTTKSTDGATGVPPVDAHERILIPDQDGDRPRWAPDGKRFAFLSTKEGGSQIWIADFDSASGKVTGVNKLTAIATEASGELWSPDGKNILFVSDVYPECDSAPLAAQQCNAKKLEEHEKSKVKALIFDRLLYRHWNAYKEGKRTHIFVVSAPILSESGGPSVQPPTNIDRIQGPAALPPRDLTPGDFDAPVFSLGGQDNYAFSPDGQEVCYTSNHDKVEATSTNNDLWIVPVNGGAGVSPVQPKNITADNPASDSTPLYSPDGKYIAYRAQTRPGYESDRFRLMLYDRKTGERKNITEKFDRWVGSFGWAGGHDIYMTAENEGGSPIYFIMLDLCPSGCHPIKILNGFNDDISAGEKSVSDQTTQLTDTVLFTRMSLQAPIELFALDRAENACVPGLEKTKARLVGTSTEELPKCAEGRARQLTHLNDAVLSQIAMSPLETFWFEGAKGDKVQGFLVKPPNFDANKKYPVKFLIHGGPQGAWGDDWSYRWNPELFAASGYVVIMINFRGSTGYGQKFIDEINGNWGGAPYEDLMKGLDYAGKTYPFIDKDRECALGASYGGYATNWILGHTTRFKCIVTHDGMLNSTSAWGTTEELWFNEWEFKGTPYTNRAMYDKWSPHMYATNFKTPTLVVHGQLDYRLDVSEGFQLFTTLQRHSIPSKMLYFPDEGHWVLKPQNSQLWYKTVNAWVDQWTKSK